MGYFIELFTRDSVEKMGKESHKIFTSIPICTHTHTCTRWQIYSCHHKFKTQTHTQIPLFCRRLFVRILFFNILMLMLLLFAIESIIFFHAYYHGSHLIKRNQTKQNPKKMKSKYQVIHLCYHRKRTNTDKSIRSRSRETTSIILLWSGKGGRWRERMGKYVSNASKSICYRFSCCWNEW